MAIGLTTKNSYEGSSESSSTFSLHTESDLTNDILIVTTACRDGTDADMVISDITYNSVSLTKVRGDNNSGGGIRTEIWYLKNPSTGGNNVVITYTGTVDHTSACAMVFEGVDQTTPIDTSAYEENDGEDTPMEASITTGVANAVLVDVFYNKVATDLTPSSPQVKLWQEDPNSNGDRTGGSLRYCTTATSYTMEWTYATANEDNVQSIVSLNPDSGDTSYNAIRLTGYAESYAKIDNFSGIDGLTDYTIEYWVKNDATSVPYSRLTRMEDASDWFHNFTTENGTGNQGFNMATNYGGANNADGFESSNRIIVGTWTAVSVMHNATTKLTSVFINGAENNNYNLYQSGDGSLDDPTGMDLYVGKMRADTNIFNGAIGGYFRVWDRALTAGEIYDNYNKTLDPANESDLIVNCNFTEESGTTVDNDATAGADLDIYDNAANWCSGPSLSAKSYTNSWAYGQVLGQTDDSEQNSSGTTNVTNSSDLEIPYDGVQEGFIGMRFDNMTVPNAATIESAYVVFTGDETKTAGTVDVTIYGIDEDDVAAFTTDADHLGGKTLTSASVAWASIPNSEPGQIQLTPDIASVIQEIVNRGGWVSGQAIGVMIQGDAGIADSRTYEAFDGQRYSAPSLIVEYSTGGIKDIIQTNGIIAFSR